MSDNKAETKPDETVADQTESTKTESDEKVIEKNGKPDKVNSNPDKDNGHADKANGDPDREKTVAVNGDKVKSEEKPSSDKKNKNVEEEGESFLSQLIHISIIVVLTAVLISLWNTYQVSVISNRPDWSMMSTFSLPYKPYG